MVVQSKTTSNLEDAVHARPLRVVFVCLNVCFHAIQDLWFPFPGNLSMSLRDYGISWNSYVLHEVHLHDVSIVQCLERSFFSWFLNVCRERYNLQFKPLYHLQLGELVIARCLGISCVCKCFLCLGRRNRSKLLRTLQTFEEMWEPMLFLRIGMSIEVTLKLYLSCKASSKTVD